MPDDDMMREDLAALGFDLDEVNAVLDNPPACKHPHILKLWAGMHYQYTCGTITCRADLTDRICPKCEGDYHWRKKCEACGGTGLSADDSGSLDDEPPTNP